MRTTVVVGLKRSQKGTNEAERPDVMPIYPGLT